MNRDVDGKGGYGLKMSRGQELCLFKFFSKENNIPDLEIL